MCTLTRQNEFFCVSHELLGVLIPCHISHIYIGLVVSYAGLKYELLNSGHCKLHDHTNDTNKVMISLEL